MSGPSMTLDPYDHAGATIATRAGASSHAHGGVVQLTAWARLVEDTVWLSARVPLGLASIEQPAASYADAVALGNVELTAHFRRAVWRRDAWKLSVGTAVGLGLPTALEDPLHLDARALVLANALAGASSPELFRPGLVPVRASVSTTLEHDRWSTRLAIAAVSTGQALVELEAGGWLFGPLGASAGLRVLSGTVILEPALYLRASRFVTLALEASIVPRWSSVGVGPSLRVAF